MQWHIILKVIGLLLSLFSITMLPPIFVGLWYQDGAIIPFIITFFITCMTGIISWLNGHQHHAELRIRDGFIIVAMFWTVLGLFGALPFALATNPHMSYTDAVFESLSGLTATGATVIASIDTLPHSILYYRQQLQWLGGMGIIVLAVAILPMLGIGGMQLYRAETPGPVKDNKLAPRIAETAKALWYIYLGLTICCASAYWLAGMSIFDAIGHSFSTVALGGFSTHDASMAYFQSSRIEFIAIFFMFIAGINFSLHFHAWHAKTLSTYFQDSEARTYITIIAIIALVTTTYLYTKMEFQPFDAFRYALFQTVSFATTTGFTTTQDYPLWPAFLPTLLLFSSFIGGCSGSTGGGIKVIRCLLLIKQGLREIRRLIHPNAILQVKIGRQTIPDQVISSVWGFFATYVTAFAIMMTILMTTGLNQVTAFSAVAACMNNLGPGLGDVAANYINLSDASKWVLAFAMLLGRLEIFTLLVLLTPEFWRK